MLKKVGRIDKTVPIPLYFQLKELVLSEIKEGNYKSGDMIPTEKEISDSFGISRTTVRQAITELVQEGWLYRHSCHSRRSPRISFVRSRASTIRCTGLARRQARRFWSFPP